MPEARLTDSEVQEIHRVLRAVAVRTRTGELGVMHGLNRVVSTQTIFRRGDLEALDAATRKLGLGAGVKRTDK